MTPASLSRAGALALIGLIAGGAGMTAGLLLGNRSEPTSEAEVSKRKPASRSVQAPTVARRSDLLSRTPEVVEESSKVDRVPAERIWQSWTSKPPSPDARDLLRNLRPEMADFFIRQFRNPSSSEERQLALDLAMGCGGSEAAALLEELISAPSTAELNIDRINLTAFLLGNGVSKRPKALPIPDSLMARTRALMDSESGHDRSLAVAILGYGDPQVVNSTLMNALQTDADPWVRQITVHVLARTGDQALLTYFIKNRDRLASEMASLYKPKPSPPGTPVVIVSSHHFAGAIDDAIEEMVERLQSKK